MPLSPRFLTVGTTTKWCHRHLRITAPTAQLSKRLGFCQLLYTGQIKEYLLATYSLRIDFFYLTGFLRKSRCFQSVCTMFLYQYAHEYLSKEVNIFSAHLHDVYHNICTYAFIHIQEDIGTNLATTTEKSSKVWKFEPPNPSYETNVHTHMPNSLRYHGFTRQSVQQWLLDKVGAGKSWTPRLLSLTVDRRM